MVATVFVHCGGVETAEKAELSPLALMFEILSVSTSWDSAKDQSTCIHHTPHTGLQARKEGSQWRRPARIWLPRTGAQGEF